MDPTTGFAMCSLEVDLDLGRRLCFSEIPNTDGNLPEWIMLVPAGREIKALDGRRFSNTQPQVVVDAFNEDPRDLPIDWEHATEERAPDGKPAPAAGWIDTMEVREGAIWGHIKEWTPRGAESLKTREYRYLSPAFLFQKATKVVRLLTSAALTNRPALDMPALARAWAASYVNDLPDSAFLYIERGGQKDGDGKTTPLSLRHFPYRDKTGAVDIPHLRNAIARIPQARIEGLDQAALQRLQERARRLLDQTQRGTARTEDDPMNPELLKLLGLEDGASDEQVLDAVKKLGSDPAAELEDVKKEAAELRAKLETSEQELANARSAQPALDQYVPRGDYDKAVARVKELENDKAADEKKSHDAAVETAISAALQAGKITPATKGFYVATCSTAEGLAKFNEFVEAQPAIADPSNIDDRDPPSGGDKKVTDEQLAIAARCGVDAETFKAAL